jgi:hypothetical protein
MYLVVFIIYLMKTNGINLSKVDVNTEKNISAPRQV